MKRLIILALLCLLFAGASFASCLKPTSINQAIQVESESCFYGSSAGSVVLDLDLTGKNITAKDFFVRIIGLETYASARISEITYNGVKVETTSYPASSQSKTKLSLAGLEKKEMKIKITFDPREVRYGKEFIVRLETKDGTLVGDLDPFLSGYDYRRQLTITNNASSSLPDTNTTIKLVLGSTLGAKAQADCDDVRITSGETTELDRNYRGNCQSDANIFFPLKFAIGGSGSDSNYYVYYGNASATAPAGVSLALPAPDSKSAVYCALDNTLTNYSGGTACSNSGTIYTTTRVAGEGAITNDNKGDYIETNWSPQGEASMSVEFWINFADTAKQRFAGARTGAPIDMLEFIVEDDGTLRALVYNDGGALYDLTSAQKPATNAYSHIAFTCGSTGAKLWYNGNVISRNASTACPNLTGGTTLIFGNSKGTSGEELSANSEIDEIRISTGTQRVNYPYFDINSQAEQPSVSIGAEELDTIPVYRITWNVFRKDTSVNLASVGVDSNVNAYDLANQTSQFYQDLNKGHYLITFSRAGYDNNANYFLNADSNKTLTIYLTDSTAPSVGITTLSGFTISGAYIKGTGSIFGGSASDAGSDLNTSTCEYTANNGGAWASADWNADTTKCQKTGYAISNLDAFRANTRIKDIAGNTGTGTATSAYTGDTNAPSTTYAGCGAGTNATPQTITLTCNDIGVGCASTYYRIDAGAWTNYVAPFTISTSGNHVVDYNSRDSLDNIQAVQSSDCNILIPNFAPVISVFYPNGGESLIKPNVVGVIFTIRDSDDNSALIDLNYSANNTEGTGTEILIDENTSGGSITCDDSDFSNDTNCSFSWNIAGVPDGNYYLLVTGATDGNSTFDPSNATFEITTAVVPPVSSDNNYSQRYINASDPIKDSNRYYSTSEPYKKTDAELQTDYLGSINTFLYVLIVIIIAVVVFWLWKKRR